MRVALGWLNWSPEVAEFCDVNAILAGYEGRVDMLRTIFGGAPDDGPPAAAGGTPALPPLTPGAFDSIVRGATRGR